MNKQSRNANFTAHVWSVGERRQNKHRGPRRRQWVKEGVGRGEEGANMCSRVDYVAFDEFAAGSAGKEVYSVWAAEMNASSPFTQCSAR